MTRRHQLTTPAGKLRLLRFAGQQLADLLPDEADNLPAFALATSGRLKRVGITHATPGILEQYAAALDSLDGLSTGRYDLPLLLPDLTSFHDWEGARDSLENRLTGDIRFYEDLVTVRLS
jgi:hypothetical protein